VVWVYTPQGPLVPQALRWTNLIGALVHMVAWYVRRWQCSWELSTSQTFKTVRTASWGMQLASGAACEDHACS
jgi:hypothetical protein